MVGDKAERVAVVRPENGDVYAGQVHVARQQGGSPVALSSWRVTTGDRAVADAMDKVFHVCDGGGFLEPAGKRGVRCGCVTAFADRKAAAKSGRGPRPEMRMDFRPAGTPGARVFFLASSPSDRAEPFVGPSGALQ